MFPIFTIFCAILYFIPTLFANPTDVSSDSISIEKIIPNIIQQEIIKSRLLVELEIGKETTNNKKSNYWSKKANREKNQKLKILYYKKAIRFSPKNNWHYYDLGSYFLEIKQHQKSIKILLKMLDFNQYIIFAYYDLAENYQALKQDKKAIHFYTQYIQRRVNHSSCCNPAYVTKHYFKALVQRGIRYKA
ncbi:MAG: tetratricopeptide (TPR) repeat protein, partial [bacterium]